MDPQTQTLLQAVQSGQARFADVLAHIDARYRFTPTAFTNHGVANAMGRCYGTCPQPTAFTNHGVANAAGQNSGACRVLDFARLHKLSQADTLALFAEHYQSVLAAPQGSDHANIRAFMQGGWAAVAFAGPALQEI